MDKKKGNLMRAMAQRIMGILLAAIMVFYTLPVSGFAVSASEKMSFAEDIETEDLETEDMGTEDKETEDKETEDMETEDTETEDAGESMEDGEGSTALSEAESREPEKTEDNTKEADTEIKETEDTEPENTGLCRHHEEHTADCGYSEEDNILCGYECGICPLEDLIDTLPVEVTGDNAEDVLAKLEEILALYGELTESEQEEVDISRCLELQAILKEQGDQPEADEPVPAAAEGETSINLTYYPTYIFANGIPIVIREEGGTTNIYDTGGELLVSDVSNSRIYGGAYNSSSTCETSIVMESGMVESLYGGSFGMSLTGNTKIIMLGGTVRNIYGGGYGSNLYGNSSVEINGGTVLNAVYGSGYLKVQQGSATVRINRGHVEYVYGGGDSSIIMGDTNVIIDDSTVSYYVYGGGSSSGSGEGVGGNTNVTISGNSTIGYVYGGGWGTLVTGTANVTINKGVEIIGFPTLSEKGAVFGGGNGGSVKNTHVTFNGGDLAELYGGGENCKDTTEAYLQIMGSPDAPAKIYGGGKSGTAKKVTMELHNLDYQTLVCGGGNNDAVEEVEIIIDSSCNLDGTQVCARIGASTVGSARFRVTVASQDSKMVPYIHALNGEGVTGKVAAHISGIGTSYQNYGTRLLGIKELTVEGCQFQFSAFNEALGKLTLDKLEILSSGEVFFTNELKDVTIGELAGSGTIRFFGLNGGNIPTVIVNKVDALASLKVGRYGGLITNNIWENTILFQGAGISALESADCFVSAQDDAKNYVPQKTEDGSGIKMTKLDTRKETVIGTAYFDKPIYRYGESIQVTVGLSTRDDKTPLAGQRVALVSGREGPRTIAESATGADGLAIFTLPVKDSLWNDFPDNSDSYLMAFFNGNEEYLGSRSLVYLKDGDSEYHFSFDKTDIVLDEAIIPPKVDEVPSGLLTSGEFYTARIEWSPKDALFRPNQAYTADLRILPKTGYSLTPDKIGSVTYGGKELPFPDSVEADGSLLFKATETYDPIPAYWITVYTSPKEGGTISHSTANGVATLTAHPAAGWHFVHWTEDGEVIADTAEFSFTTSRHRSITAVFEKEEMKNCDHKNTERRNVVTATCQKKGYSGDIYCLDCDELVKKGTETGLADHSGGTATCISGKICVVCGAEYSGKNSGNHTHTEIRGAVGATCTADGYTGDTYCTGCKAKIGTGTVIHATGHDWHITSEEVATTTSEGRRVYTCSKCLRTREESIPKLPDTCNDQLSDGQPGNGGTEENRPESGKPFIKGEPSKDGWKVIKEETDKAEDGNTVAVDMNGSTVVPGDVLEHIRGRDIAVVFDMGNGITWSVNGKSVGEGKIGDIDFSVETGTEMIPADIINNVTGERYSIQLSLAYNGEFGFTAVLSIDLGSENAGFTASLYYYNENTGELEFICADEVAEDGTVSFVFTHASDYVIVVEGVQEEGGVMESAQTEGTDGEVGTDTAVVESLQTGQPWKPWGIVVFGALVIVMGISMFCVIRKRKEKVDEEM